MNYFPQGIVKCERKFKKRTEASRGSFRLNIVRPSHLEYQQEFENYPTNTIPFNFKEGKRVHPTQKPVALLEYLIKTYTNEGETVLDFTAGSFSTGVAAVNTGREFIGIEKDENYFAIGKKRVEDAIAKKRIGV